MAAPFVLDLAANPHPTILDGALRRRAAADHFPSPENVATWLGYLAAMVDATGETPEALNAWLDAHE